MVHVVGVRVLLTYMGATNSYLLARLVHQLAILPLVSLPFGSVLQLPGHDINSAAVLGHGPTHCSHYSAALGIEVVLYQ